jgi:hypothetical protein
MCAFNEAAGNYAMYTHGFAWFYKYWQASIEDGEMILRNVGPSFDFLKAEQLWGKARVSL